MARLIDCWLSVDGYPAEIQLPTELLLQLHAMAKEHDLVNIDPTVPVTGRLAVVIEGALQRAVEPVADGPMLTAVLFGKGLERITIYFVNRDPASTLSSMQQQGWKVIGQQDLPQPFAGCKRVMVYHGDELLKAQS